MKINGVNLGNWLVLEKWMSPTVFAGTDAEDEAYLIEKLPADVYEARIRNHRAEYITERDFLRIWSMGFNTVRIPVPYYIFGDRKPFIGCVEELDNAFDWAENYGLQILIDLHTAPESQNGFDNGGLCGIVKWATLPDEVEFELTVLERLAERYGNRKGLFGIEVLNEPLTPEIFDIMNIPEKFPAVDPKRAEGTCPVQWDFLEDFYARAYERMVSHMAKDKYVVLHDGFNLLHWENFFMQGPEYGNVVFDTHNYMFSVSEQGYEASLAGYEKFIDERFDVPFTAMSSKFKVICGEWCLANGLTSHMECQGLKIHDDARREIFNALCRKQLAIWEKGFGHFFWSYKLLSDCVHHQNAGWLEGWDLDRCVNYGWYPLD